MRARQGVRSARPPDSLTRADDAAIVPALRGDPWGSQRSRRLAGRRLETAAYAGLAPRRRRGAGILSARFAARLARYSPGLTAVGQGLHIGETGVRRCRRRRPGGRERRFGAVESARGRLYHWAEIGPDEWISPTEYVAPTEWNFHAAGPFVAALLGGRVGPGEAARLAGSAACEPVRPCVAFDVTLKEPAHA